MEEVHTRFIEDHSSKPLLAVMDFNYNMLGGPELQLLTSSNNTSSSIISKVEEEQDEDDDEVAEHSSNNNNSFRDIVEISAEDISQFDQSYNSYHHHHNHLQHNSTTAHNTK